MDMERTHGIRVSGFAFLCLAVAYVYSAPLVFLLGWTRIYVSLPIIVCVGFATRDMLDVWKQSGRHAPSIRISPLTFIVICVVLFFVAYLVGWGGLAPQSNDWPKHNAILHDLINCPWPVTFSNGDETSMLTYYIGQYLVPASIGKATGSFEAAVICELIWNYLGLLLVCCGVIRVLHADSARKQYVCLAVLLTFGGLICLGQAVVRATMPTLLPSNYKLYHWFSYVSGVCLQYSPDFVLLRWVFNQTIVPWLLLTIFFEKRDDIRFYVPLALPMALYGIMPFLGTMFLMICYALVRLIRDRRRKRVVKWIFSPPNLLCGLSLGPLLFFYYAGNVLSVKPSYLSVSLTHYGVFWPVYFIFVFFTFGIYALLILKRYRKDPLFLICVVALLLIPFFRMGVYNDFVMRTSIPFLFLLMLMVCEYLLERAHDHVGVLVKIALVVCLAIAAVEPLQELSDSERYDVLTDLTQSNDGYVSIGYSANRSLENKPIDLRYNYLSYDLDGNFFAQHLARELHPQVREDWR